MPIAGNGYAHASASVGGAVYTYDADGQRVTRTASSGITTLFIGGVYEQDTPSIQRSQYRFAGRVIAQRTLNAPKPLLYLHSDALGSVSAVTDGSGTVVERQEFGPWGNIRSGGVSATTVNYTGQKRDGTGLLYYNARYYDPALGRFLSADTAAPIQENPQSLNRYANVGNNPVNHTDPRGHDFDAGGSGGCDALSCGNEGGGIGSTGTGIGQAFGGSLSDEILITTGCGDACGSGVLADPLPPPGPTVIADPTPDPLPTVLPDPTSTPLPECCYDPIPEPTTGGSLINTPTVPGFEGDVAGIPGGGVLAAAPGAPGGSGGNNNGRDPKGGTYTLRDPVTGDVMRTGRTNDLDRRQGEHQRTFPELEFNIEHKTDDKNVQRGLAQIDHEKHNPPLDKRNEIAPSNVNRDKYLNAARRFLAGG